MPAAPFHPGLAHRLLVAAARAHHQGEPPLDWEDLAAVAGAVAPPKSVNRALAHLAEEGLIEGVSTPAGWLSVRATPRGIGRAGRAARRPAPEAIAAVKPSAQTAAIETSDLDSEREPVAAQVSRHVSDDLRRAGEVAVEVRSRLSRALAPRLTSMRTTMAQAWHTFTTLP